MSTDNKEPEVLNKVKTLDDIRIDLDRFQSSYDPEYVLKKAEPRLESLKNSLKSEVWQASVGEDLFKALTLSEFRNGSLLATIVPEQYRTFGIDMLRKLQEEYSCTTISEQATVEVIVLSFIRVLELQRRIDNYLENDGLRSIDMTYFSLLSKELDRASRQYLTALQTIRMFKQPQLKVNIKTNTAIVGQNQLIQENQNVKPI